MTATVTGERVGPLRIAAALLCGVLILVAAGLRLREEEFVWGGAEIRMATGVVILCAMIVAWVRVRRFDFIVLALGLSACGMVLYGLPDLPHWPSIEDFGRSRLFYFVILAMAVLGLVLGTRRDQSPADTALFLFVLFSAFGGAMFLRRTDDFFPAFILLALVGCTAVSDSQRRAWWKIPFLSLFLLFLALLIPSLLVAADLDRHLVALSRVAVAGLPIVVLGLGRRSADRAHFAAKAYAVAVTGGAVCVIISVLEAGWYVDLYDALKARLHLFGVHPNFIAPYFAVAPPLLLALLLASGRRTTRILFGTSLVLACGSLWLTRSRASLAAAATGVVVFVGVLLVIRLYRRRPGRSTAVLLVLGSALLAGGALFAGKEYAVAKLSDSSMEFRVFLWGVATDAIQEKPLLGHGLLNGEPIAVNATSSHLDGRTKNLHPHNLLLAIALGAGIWAGVAFVWLLVMFVIRMLAAAALLPEREDRLLAVGALASAISLLFANMMDQGLAQNTPFPLHLGLLLGIGAMLRRLTVGKKPVSVSRTGPVLFTVSTLLVAVLAIWALASERLSGRVMRFLQNGDLTAAQRLSGVAVQVNPLSLRIGMQRVRVLQANDQTGKAIDRLEELTESHPMSVVPWEALSSLALDRGRWQESLEALRRARALDKTGPMMAEWSLREARILLRMDDVMGTLRAMADAFRFDYEAPRRLDWKKDEFGDWMMRSPSGESTIRLVDALRLNADLIPGLSETDLIRARRVAAALTKIYMLFGYLDLAQAVIDQHRDLTGTRFRSLDYMEIQIRERRIKGGDEGAKSLDADLSGSGPSDGEFRTAGQASLFVAEGRRLRAAGRMEEALAKLREGLDQFNDMQAEREYLAWHYEEIYGILCQTGDTARAFEWLPGLLYFHGRAPDRLDWTVELVNAQRAASRPGEVLQTLEVVLPAICFLDRHALKRVGQWAKFAAPLLRDDASEDVRQGMESLLERCRSTGSGLRFGTLAYASAGRADEAQRWEEELRASFPAYALN